MGELCGSCRGSKTRGNGRFMDAKGMKRRTHLLFAASRATPERKGKAFGDSCREDDQEEREEDGKGMSLFHKRLDLRNFSKIRQNPRQSKQKFRVRGDTRWGFRGGAFRQSARS